MEFRIPRMEFPIPRAAPRIPRNSPRAPRMAFSLRERFSLNWGGPQASEFGGSKILLFRALVVKTGALLYRTGDLYVNKRRSQSIGKARGKAFVSGGSASGTHAVSGGRHIVSVGKYACVSGGQITKYIDEGPVSG